VGGLIADSAGGGQHAPEDAETKKSALAATEGSAGQGDSTTNEAKARHFARWRGRARNAGAACKPQAGERRYRWPAPWRSGGGAGGDGVRQEHVAVARDSPARRRGSSCEAGAKARRLRGLEQAP